MKVKKETLLKIINERVDKCLNNIQNECNCKCSKEEKEIDEKENIDEKISPEMMELIKKNLSKQGGYVKKVGDRVVGRPFVNVLNKKPRIPVVYK